MRGWKKLIAAETIAARIAVAAATLERDYAGQEIVLVGVLNGALFFLADLARALRLPMRVDTLLLQSYGDATASTGHVRLLQDVRSPLADRHVLIVDDIFDSGRTLRFALDHLARQRPASLAVACLLVKDAVRAAAVEVQYGLIPIPNEFVVGYGLDLAGWGRNLPDIWALPADVSEEAAAQQLRTQSGAVLETE